jgi:hypothetical protein
MDYDLGINYNLDKAHVFTDALSQRSHPNVLAVKEIQLSYGKILKGLT